MGPGACSGTLLAVLIVEATPVEPLAYPFVPAPQFPPEIHSLALSANPLRSRLIAQGQGHARFPLFPIASSAAHPPERPRHSAICREAL